MTTAWYAARAGGMLAFALLTASVVLGLALSGRARPRRRLGGADNQDARALPVRPSALTGRAARPLFQTTSERWPRFAVEDVHRFVGLLAGGFVGVHVLALLVDTYVPFSLAQVLVPGASSYRPLATGLGVVGWSSSPPWPWRTGTASACRTGSGGARTTSTSPSGP